ncbi:MAG: 4Fe-4S dicluster domain-containing protein [Bacteroidales bacterium]
MNELDLYSHLKQDFRIIEGLHACINCGMCTAICPAAEFYEYDPRFIATTVQTKDNDLIETLLKSETIWFCGECLSCKTRCPRNNTPGYIIQALRALSVQLGYFVENERGRQQLAIKRTVGEHILKYGYCVYPDEIDTEKYPEQGPIWDWMIKNKEKVFERLNANYKGNGAGALRQISEQSLIDLQKIFDATGATERFQQIEDYSKQVAERENIQFSEGTDNLYFKNIYENISGDEK